METEDLWDILIEADNRKQYETDNLVDWDQVWMTWRLWCLPLEDHLGFVVCGDTAYGLLLEDAHGPQKREMPAKFSDLLDRVWHYSDQPWLLKWVRHGSKVTVESGDYTRTISGDWGLIIAPALVSYLADAWERHRVVPKSHSPFDRGWTQLTPGARVALILDTAWIAPGLLSFGVPAHVEPLLVLMVAVSMVEGMWSTALLLLGPHRRWWRWEKG
ncbi:MAG: hypothetical protein C7B46_18785 [Sulfobacillus benefaciens]|uniref:Uncharacterized protein n=1 Tax=Sulfobacillus benefaciens TaxID=453960 RepID=A0A2T2X3L9_9FIRM|nr:MAG: hypothetical protein C7B46_18785 [Sulfobacillus benefaciens]